MADRHRLEGTDELVDRIATGDSEAVELLLNRHRDRLRRMISLRLDKRLAGRVDPSDVIQDTLEVAAGRLEEFARVRPLPFFPWLRQIAIDRLVDTHRRHLEAKKRSVNTEERRIAVLSDETDATLARHFISKQISASEFLRRSEAVAQAQEAIESLSPRDREVLVLRYLEQLSTRDAAAVLGISENAFAQRHLRALKRIRIILSELEDQ